MFESTLVTYEVQGHFFRGVGFAGSSIIMSVITISNNISLTFFPFRSMVCHTTYDKEIIFYDFL